MTIKCNAIIRTLGDLVDLVERLERLTKGSNPEFAVPLEIWMEELQGKLAAHRRLYWSKADPEDLLDMEEAERQLREDSDPRCSCRMETVDSASTEPPELIRDEWCPVHGRDPDAELDRRRDDAMERDR
jgi:hypothetical protein